MSFDARSRERLQALGRSLPQPLPKPEPPQQSQTKASDRRHKVELEQNPEALFRELMQVSPDGTVPPHLMERLRELESRRQSVTPAPAQVFSFGGLLAGTLLGHALVTWLAVGAGKWIGQWVNERLLYRLSGGLFLVFGLAALSQALS